MHRVFLLCCLLLCACSAPPSTYKIALVAPFEGRQRQVGYDAFPALRMAVREQITANKNAATQITFVAYNDNADPEFAARVAHNVVIDPAVLVVIGHLITATTQAGLPIYQAAGIAVLMLDDTATDCARRAFHINASPAQLMQAQPVIEAHYREVAGGPAPGAGTALAYLAAQQALQAVRAAIAKEGRPTRVGVARLLAQAAGCP